MSVVMKEYKSPEGDHVRSLVKTDGGKYYCVDTCDTFDVGPETMVFPGSEDSILPEGWGSLYSRRFLDMNTAMEFHKMVTGELEKYLASRYR